MTTSSRASKHVWTKKEEDTLVECLVELVSIGGWKSNNGANMQWVQLERSRKMHNCGERAKELLNKPFPYYDEFAYVFGRDKAMCRFAMTFADIGSNESVGMRGLTCRMGMRSSHRCTAGGLTCPTRMYAHHDLLAHQRVGSNRADRRERGEASKRARLKSYILPLSH
ncbi:retrotransposon protein [Cucumis melo var. makuwa]|uniref:Retrotransposon protein n=1 Tax=Cucumis melo var. makuwa TaxID=1194695 RepID=A0A5D3CHZ6_CUCMM|nr:retrotransposon protein [Cucumis melo var. makuwa]TYK11537.1 retrotransposon protein [Cucumis melo var. makuwa]